MMAKVAVMAQVATKMARVVPSSVKRNVTKFAMKLKRLC
jgi:hypothetical protein